MESKDRKISVIELYGFETDEDVQEFFGEILANHKWGKGQYIKISNLNDVGIAKADKYLLNAEEEAK